MINKVKILSSLVFKDTFTIYYVSKEKIKNFSADLFDKSNRQRGFAILPWVVVTAVVALFGTGYQAISKAGGDFVAGLGMFLISIGSTVFNIGIDFLTFVLSPPFSDYNITGDPTFISGWTSVRDIANLFIVLGFVVIGISFALRIGEYGSKKVLFSLIIIALLVNFSGLFCGLIIDASNIIMKDLLRRGGGSGSFSGIQNAVDNYTKEQMGRVNSFVE